METNERKTSDVQQDQVKAKQSSTRSCGYRRRISLRRRGAEAGKVKKRHTNPPGGCFY